MVTRLQAEGDEDEGEAGGEERGADDWGLVLVMGTWRGGMEDVTVELHGQPAEPKLRRDIFLEMARADKAFVISLAFAGEEDKGERGAQKWGGNGKGSVRPSPRAVLLEPLSNRRPGKCGKQIRRRGKAKGQSTVSQARYVGHDYV